MQSITMCQLQQETNSLATGNSHRDTARIPRQALAQLCKLLYFWVKLSSTKYHFPALYSESVYILNKQEEKRNGKYSVGNLTRSSRSINYRDSWQSILHPDGTNVYFGSSMFQTPGSVPYECLRKGNEKCMCLYAGRYFVFHF